MRYIVVHQGTGERVIGPLDDADFDGKAAEVAESEQRRLNIEAGGQQVGGRPVRYVVETEPADEP
jgi:hypothetical protein